MRTSSLARMPADFSQTERQIREVQDGDRTALDDLFARYLPRVRRLVASRLGRSGDELASIDDLVQETFHDAITGIDRLEMQSDGAFCNWLAQVVENNVRDHQRRGLALKRGAGDVRRFGDLGETMLCDSIFAGRDPTASQIAHAAETEARIEQAMRQLDERYREVIHLRAFCEMSHKEVAETMGLPTENTANLLFLRARDKLRRILERRT